MEKEEIEIINCSADLWNKFAKLEQYHNEDINYVRGHINAIQAIVMSRETIRNNPNLFNRIGGSTKQEKKGQ